MRKYFLGIILFSLCFQVKSWAQDVIIKLSGDEIYAKVTRVGDLDIEYRKPEQVDGPLYTIRRSEIFMIKYQDGTKDVFNERNNTNYQNTQPTNGNNPQSGPVNFDIFYQNLSPYGEWVDHPNHGYVWIPNVAPGFTPYSTNGHWINTIYGWTWNSSYEWGWAPFHYGRWDFDEMYGWYWVPGNIWGPAWVSWRRSAGYYGWAPIMPGVEIDVVLGNNYIMPAERWTFVQERYMGMPTLYDYYAPPSSNVIIFRSSTVINHTYIDHGSRMTFISGPEVIEVQRTTGRTINRVEIVERHEPGHVYRNNEYSVYRPRIEERREGPGSRPVHYVPLRDVKPLHEREEHFRTHPEEHREHPDQKREPEHRMENERRKEPRRTEPEHREPVKNEPQRNEPNRTEPNRTQPEHKEPVRNEKRVEPEHHDPVRQETRPQPQQKQPVKNEQHRDNPSNRRDNPSPKDTKTTPENKDNKSKTDTKEPNKHR